ncbi:MAG: DUF4115 domain-containing protein [Nocardioidaceae bacterium]
MTRRARRFLAAFTASESSDDQARSGRPNGSTRVQVTDSAGKVPLKDDFAFGESRSLKVPDSFTVTTADGGALTVSLGRHDVGLLGQDGKPATRTFAEGATD